MCVIATGLKKDFQTEWFEQCCTHNPDGFFVSRVNKNQSIRTLDYDKALSFFNKSADNDTIVLHARIKSVGDVTDANVHGWKHSGVQFCHNGTLSIKASDGRTDSETFFQDIFLPIYEYNGKTLCDATDRAIDACIGSSRFLIIRRRKVHLYGTYTEHGNCKFSNMIWQPKPTYKPALTTTTNTTSPSVWSPYSSNNPYYPLPSTSKKGNQLLSLLPSRVILNDYDLVLRKLNSFVDKEKLPAYAPLLVYLDGLSLITSSTAPKKSWGVMSYPYMLWLWQELFGFSDSKQDEIISKLNKLLTEPGGIAEPSSLYNFLSREVRPLITGKVVGCSDRAALLRTEVTARNAISSSTEWRKYTQAWTEDYAQPFLRALSPLLSYGGLFALRRMVKAGTSNQYLCPSLTYSIYATLHDLAYEVQYTSFTILHKILVSYIDKLYEGGHTFSEATGDVAEEFWRNTGILFSNDFSKLDPTEMFGIHYKNVTTLTSSELADEFMDRTQIVFDQLDDGWVYDSEFTDSTTEAFYEGFLVPPQGKKDDRTVSLATTDNR